MPDSTFTTVLQLARALDTSAFVLLLTKDDVEALRLVLADPDQITTFQAALADDDLAKLQRLVRSGAPRGQKDAAEFASRMADSAGISGGAAGAAIGTMILPGLGTAIGAALGAVVASRMLSRKSDKPPPSSREDADDRGAK